MIVLYNPQSTDSHKKPLPMSLLALASVLEGVYEYVIVDGNLESDPVGRIVEVARQQPLTAVGISVMPGPQLDRAVPQSRELKRACPDVPIVWGGYFPSQHADTVLKDSSVDFCVRGQGEQTFLELVQVLTGGGALSSIDGLSFTEEGTIRSNPSRALIPLDSLPDWPYYRVPMERYIYSHYMGSRVGAHHSSYGCPFGCNFCAIVGIVNRSWVAQAPERVARIVREQHQRYAVDAIQFHDMDFFISEPRAAECAERITDLGIRWWALGRVDELMRYSDATWRTLSASGLKMVYCGVESGSDEALARMNKGGKASADAALDLAGRMRSFGIVPEYSFVLGNPPDPLADINATLRFIRRLKAVNPDTEVILYMYTPVPLDGTLYDEARTLGFSFPDTLDEWVSASWQDFSLRRNPKNPWLDPGLARRVRNFERVLNAYYPTVTDMRLHGAARAILRSLGGWRYWTHVYAAPVELRGLQRLLRYQRPETVGF